jgi:hypothetical protein
MTDRTRAEQAALLLLTEHDCQVDYDRTCRGCSCQPWHDGDHDEHAAHLVQILAAGGLLA